MGELVEAMLSFPTVLFTALLGVVVLYWVLVLLGALDIDLAGAGGAGGALEAAADSGLEAAHQGGDAGAGGPTGVLSALGLGGVPLTVAVSFVVLWAWVLSVTGSLLWGDLAEGGLLGVALGAGTLVLALGGGLVGGARCVRPLRRLFESHDAPGHRALVGQVCTVSTLRVDGRFGQALVDDTGAGLLVQVRCPDSDNGLTKGKLALIIDYDPKDQVFVVIPFDHVLPGALSEDP